VVTLLASCPDATGPTLRAIALLNQAKMSVVLTMSRNNPSASCDVDQYLREPRLE
jgi:hypothetical protein